MSTYTKYHFKFASHVSREPSVFSCMCSAACVCMSSRGFGTTSAAAIERSWHSLRAVQGGGTCRAGGGGCFHTVGDGITYLRLDTNPRSVGSLPGAHCSVLLNLFCSCCSRSKAEGDRPRTQAEDTLPRPGSDVRALRTGAKRHLKTLRWAFASRRVSTARNERPGGDAGWMQQPIAWETERSSFFPVENLRVCGANNNTSHE